MAEIQNERIMQVEKPIILLSKLLGLASLVIFLVSCASEPRPIEYGKDMCEYCKMTVVDQQHGAQLVTSKGRIYVFDAIECMARYVDEQGDAQNAFELVNDYQSPGKLIAASEAHYLISKEIPSPMGAFLSAFSSKETVLETQTKKGGDTYSWSEIKSQFKREHVEQIEERPQ